MDPIAQPQQPIALQVLQPPEETHRTEYQGPQTVTKLPSKEAALALGEQANALHSEIVAGDQVHAEELKRLDAEAQAADAKAAALKNFEKQRADAALAHQTTLAALKGESAKRRADMEAKAHPTTYWEDQGAPRSVLAAFLVGINEASSGVTGRPNRAFDIFQQAEAKDRQRKLDAFTNSKEFYELAKTDEAAARQALADKMHEINQLELVRMNVLDKQLAAQTKRLGIPAAQAAYIQTRAKMEAEAAGKLAAEHAHYDTTLTSGRTTTSDTRNVGGANVPKPDALQVRNLRGDVVGQASTQQEAIKMREAHASAHQLRDLATQLKADIAQNGAVPTSGAAMQRREQLLSQIAGKLTVANQTGTLQQGEYERYAGMTKPKWWASRDASVGVLDELVDDAGRGYNRVLRAQGLSPGGASPAAQPAAAPSPQRAAPRSGQPRRGLAQPPGAAAPSGGGMPAGAVRGTYKGQRGYMLNGQFFAEGS